MTDNPGSAEQVVRGDGAAAGQGAKRAEGRGGAEGEEDPARVRGSAPDEGFPDAGDEDFLYRDLPLPLFHSKAFITNNDY